MDSLPAEPQWKPKNTGVGSLSLLQRIFLTQESNPGLLHCRRILYQKQADSLPTELSEQTQKENIFNLTGQSQVRFWKLGPNHRTQDILVSSRFIKAHIPWLSLAEQVESDPQLTKGPLVTGGSEKPSSKALSENLTVWQGPRPEC